MKCFAFVFFVGAIAIGSNASETEKLVGAQNAEVGEYPYQVSLRVAGNHFCGGALITKKHILTAAHCVYPIKKQPFLRRVMTVVTGTNSLNSGGKSYKVDSLSYYEKYVDKTEDPDFMYDIGVITLAKEVELSKLVEIVPLPTKDVKGGEDAVITGWGTMRTPDSPLSQTLKKLNVQVVSNARCQLYYLGARTIQKSHICAFRKRGTGTCSGDSGGPLVSDGEIIGVVSGGVACAKGFPDIYTRIYYYLDYVKEIIGDQSTKE